MNMITKHNVSWKRGRGGLRGGRIEGVPRTTESVDMAMDTRGSDMRRGRWGVEDGATL